MQERTSKCVVIITRCPARLDALDARKLIVELYINIYSYA